VGLLLPTLFDGLYWLFFVLVYGASTASGLYVAQALDGAAVWQTALALVAGYITFLHAFVVSLVLLKNLVQPRLQVGNSQVGATRGFLAWGLNSVFQGIFIASPFHDQVHFLFWLRFLYYRGMGMRLHPSVVLGTGAVLRQVELIRVGKGSVVGIGASLSCHVNVDGKTHHQAAVDVGERVLIGAHTSIAPGVSVGDGAVVGYRCTLSMGVTVEPGAVLGAEVFVKNNVRIGAGAVIARRSVVTCDIPAGERWEGSPAVRVGLATEREKRA
jgi:acetyltransferase-like isoleucine patch superfamily enzyme